MSFNQGGTDFESRNPNDFGGIRSKASGFESDNFTSSGESDRQQGSSNPNDFGGIRSKAPGFGSDNFTSSGGSDRQQGDSFGSGGLGDDSYGSGRGGGGNTFGSSQNDSTYGDRQQNTYGAVGDETNLSGRSAQGRNQGDSSFGGNNDQINDNNDNNDASGIRGKAQGFADKIDSKRPNDGSLKDKAMGFVGDKLGNN